jgi:hypothetical protein
LGESSLLWTGLIGFPWQQGPEVMDYSRSGTAHRRIGGNNMKEGGHWLSHLNQGSWTRPGDCGLSDVREVRGSLGPAGGQLAL